MSGAWVPAPMALLQRGVPLSLLMDLALGPVSEDILFLEREPGDLDWIAGSAGIAGRESAASGARPA